MILLWRVRYFDRNHKRFESRDLFLDTEALDPPTKAAVEACHALNRHGNGRGMLKYRALFQPEGNPAQIEKRIQEAGRFESASIHGYFEDETGAELSNEVLALAVTGGRSRIIFPPGTTQEDIEYVMAEKPQIDIATMSFTDEQLRVLAYFTRDLRELRGTAFFIEGPGTISGRGGLPVQPKTLKTAVSEEEIRSSVTIFRRLYMAREPANFQKAVDVLASALPTHPYSKWLRAKAATVAATLTGAPSFTPFAKASQCGFNVKRLIDVFLYTQYSHQPDGRIERKRQECLQAVGSDEAVLTHMFLDQTWRIAIEMWNVGQYVARFYDEYCRQANKQSDIVQTAAQCHPGIGALEKKHERKQRIIAEQSVELAKAMWRDAGNPPGGYHQYLDAATARLREELGDDHESSPGATYS